MLSIKEKSNKNICRDKEKLNTNFCKDKGNKGKLTTYLYVYKVQILKSLAYKFDVYGNIIMQKISDLSKSAPPGTSARQRVQICSIGLSI